jgi:hypothetical protein
MVCNVGSVVTMNILGNMITLGASKLILSSCCGTVVYYNGVGNEYATKCGSQCSYKNHFFKRKERNSSFHRKQQDAMDIMEEEAVLCWENSKESNKYLNSSHSTLQKAKYFSKKQKISLECKLLSNTDQEMLSTCYVCKHKNVVQCIQVLSVQQRRIVSFHMCAKHTIPSHIAQNLWGVQSFQKYVFYNFTTNSMKKNGAMSMYQAKHSSFISDSSSQNADPFKSKRGRKPKLLKFFH